MVITMSEYTTVVHGVLATYYVVTGITAVLKSYNKLILKTAVYP